MTPTPIPLDVYLAPHLRLREVACQCVDCEGRTAPMHLRLLLAWAHWRKHRDKPIYVASGYRCARRNREVGGTRDSQHLLGLSIDVDLVCTADIDPLDEDLLRELILCGFTGIGRGKTRLHIDAREKPYFWRYLADGRRKADAAAMRIFKEGAGR